MNSDLPLSWPPLLLYTIVFGFAAAPPPTSGQTPTERLPPRLYNSGHADRADIEQADVFKREIEQGKFYDVRPRIFEYLKAHPDSWRAYYLLGYGLYQTRDRPHSILALKKVLELKPDHPEAHKLLALNYVFLGRLDEAESEMKTAVELAPDSPEVRYYMGRIYYNRGVFPVALAEFEKAVALDPTYMRAYDNLGLTYQALGNETAAIESYQKAIKICEEKGVRLEWPYINLASLYNRRNDSGRALQYAELAVKINPGADEGLFQMAKAYHSSGDWEKAIEALKRAVAIKPNSFEYHYTLSQVYRRAGKTEESQKEIEIFMKLRSSVGSQPSGNAATDSRD